MISNSTRAVQFYIDFLSALKPGQTQLHLDGKVVLPAIRDFPGSMKVHNQENFFAEARFFGDPDWISSDQLATSVPVRIFIYSETDLSEEDVVTLKTKGREVNYEVQYRSKRHALERSRHETPLGFISYDSRDRDVARVIAITLGKMICPVWYDEFSLRVGANLRDSIEKGLKECHKCILILSTHFFSNGGWTKREFDSIFTREILEERQLVLPVWYNVTKREVFNYSPSLLNVKGADWTGLGEEEVCRQLFNSIMLPDSR